jgi:hypothetical protein
VWQVFAGEGKKAVEDDGWLLQGLQTTIHEKPCLAHGSKQQCASPNVFRYGNIYHI